MTIREIAKLAGVSITTVSKVINGKTSDISGATIEKVMDIVEKYDYRPNALARGLVTRQTKTIGLIIPDISNLFFASTSRGIEDRANERGYTVIFCNTDDRRNREEKAFDILSEKQVDGIIYTPTTRTSSADIIQICKESRIPIVILDRSLREDEIYTVSVDNFLGGVLAATELFKRGHMKIGCITGPHHMPNSRARYMGYKRALEDRGIDADESLVFEGDYRVDSGFEGAHSLIDAGATAIFACNDMMAYGVYRAATVLGLGVPEDISVIGFDDIYTSEILQPALTSVRQPAYEMGVAGSDILIRLLEGEEVGERQKIFDPILISRESVIELRN